ncbi:MAG: MFS transporter [Actinobacteria bacterium]|nr:MFS transporter [Actinomycetota bacterium]
MKKKRSETSLSPTILKILSSLALGMFLAALDQTVMSTAGPTIATHFAQLPNQSWLLTTYLLASLITTPIYGRLSDGFGRRRLFLAALILFLFGSILSAIAPTFILLILGRTVQGLGAGGLLSLAFAVISDVVPPRERARYVLVFVAVFGSSSLLGPIVGGVIATQNSILGIAGWRWIFILNVPIALIAIYRALRYLHVKQELHKHAFDWWGVSLFSIFVLSLLLFSQSSVSESLAHWRPFLLLSLPISAIFFIFTERRLGDSALIPIHFFRNRLFVVTVTASSFSGAAMLVGLVVVPLSIQIVHGKSPVVAGSVLIPMGVGNLIGSGLASRSVAKTGYYRWLATVGLSAFSIGFFLLYLTPQLWTVTLAVIALGFGSGLVTQFGSVVAPHSLGHRHRGSGSAINTFARQLGGVLGVGLSLATIFRFWNTHGTLTTVNLGLAGSSLRNLDSATREGFVSAANTVYLVSALLLLGVALLTRWIPNERLEQAESESETNIP